MTEPEQERAFGEEWCTPTVPVTPVDEPAALKDRMAKGGQTYKVGAESFSNLLTPRDATRIAEEWHREQTASLVAELDALKAIVNNPVTEAQFQQIRWDDSNKCDAEWFWTLGYLVSKVMHRDETPERRQHHLTAAAGLLANWHAHITADPEDETHSRDSAAVRVDQGKGNEAG